MRRNKFLLLLLLFCCLFKELLAQAPSGYQLLTASEQEYLVQKIKNQQAKVEDMSMDFTQIKVMKMMKNKVTMKGKMQFKKPQSLRIDYLNPIQMSIAMNNGQWAIKEAGKVNKFSEKTMPSLYYVNQMLLESVQGTIIQSSHFSAQVYQSKNDYYMVLIPKEAALKKWFQEVNVIMNKNTLQVEQVTLKETKEEYTQMIFYNVQQNQNLKTGDFQIK